MNPFRILILLLLAAPHITTAQQNLVSNGGFDYIFLCPSSGTGFPYSAYSNNPTASWHGYCGSPDVFHSCNPTTPAPSGNVPHNFTGYQLAATGNGYVGFAAHTASNFEYFSTAMAAMQPGLRYEVSMSVSRGDTYKYATNNIGVYFFDSGVYNWGSSAQVLPITPQVHYYNYGVITDTQNWTRLTAIYVADSFYDNIVIGPFNTPTNSYLLDSPGTGYLAAYYLVDSVVVKPLDSFYILTNKKNLCVGDTFSLVYNSLKTFNTNNVFTAQLSDASGSFSTPVNIGNVSSRVSGSVFCTIPATTSPGSNYRLRVVSSDFADTSKTNGYDIRIDTIPQKPVATAATPICQGDSIKLSASTATQNVSWKWTGPGSFTSSIINPSKFPSVLADSGNYIVQAISNACKSVPDTVRVTIHEKLQPIIANSNNNFCEPDTLKLTATNTAPTGATYSWTGPNSFTAGQQNPKLPDATAAAAAGNYIVTATRGVCITKDTVTVSIKPLPVFTAGNNTPMCQGPTIQFSANSSFGSVSYSWVGPNGFNSISASPTIPGGQPLHNGDYYVTATLNGCTFKDTATVTVHTIPLKPDATNNTPICTGDTARLTASSTTTGVSYSWTGPNSFSSSVQNPSFPNATAALDGDYILTISKNNCTNKDTTTITVKPLPVPVTLSNNGPLCAGSNLSINSTTSSAGAGYTWSGPGSFSANTQNATVSNAATTATGWYKMTVTLNGCTYKDSTLATVHPIPALPAITHTTPLCVGETLQLGTGTIAGAVYAWSGPGSFSSAMQNPTRANMQFGDTGIYKLKITVNNCTSPEAVKSIRINAVPFVVILVTPADTICNGSPALFTAYPNNHGGTPAYQWYVNGLPATTGNTYTSTMLNSGDVVRCDMTENSKCSTPATDASNDITMQVLPWLAPVVSITANPPGQVNAGDYITYTANPVNAGANPTYQWKRNGKNIVGATGKVWSANTLSNNDSISVEVISNYKCPQPATAASNYLKVQLTGIGDVKILSDFRLYPNPNNGTFVVEGITNERLVRIEVLNALGQVVYRDTATTDHGRLQKTCSVQHMTQGAYTLLLHGEAGTQAVKFVVK